MAEEFSIQGEDADGDVRLLRVAGRLDAKSAQDLMGACRRARESGRPRVILNLSGVSFVASSGIGTLLALTEEFREAGGAVHLVDLSEAVSSVVDLLNLGQFLNIGETEATAMEAIGA